jgi:hypothetical protein
LFAGPNAFSAVLTGVYHQDKRGIDDVEESYTDQQSSGVPDKVLSNLQFRRYEYQRERYGAAANFDAKPDDHTSLYLRVLYSGYLERATKHYLVLNGLDSNAGCTPMPTCIQDPNNPNGYQANVPAGAGALEQDSSDSLERIQNSVGMIGGSTDFRTFKLDYRASYALGTDLVSTSYGSTWLDNNAVTIDYDNNTNANYPSFSTPGVTRQIRATTRSAASVWDPRWRTTARPLRCSMQRFRSRPRTTRVSSSSVCRCGIVTEPMISTIRFSPPRGAFRSPATPTAPARSITTITTTLDPPSIIRR